MFFGEFGTGTKGYCWPSSAEATKSSVQTRRKAMNTTISARTPKFSAPYFARSILFNHFMPRSQRERTCLGVNPVFAAISSSVNPLK
jgi:hypothetical protein